LREKAHVHQLIVIGRKEVVEGTTELFLEESLTFGRLFWHPIAYLRIHRVICRSAIDADPFDPFLFAPLSELHRGSRMFDHIADFVGLRLVEGVSMIPGVDDEYIPFPHFHALFDVFGCIDAVILGDVGEVHDRARTDKLVQRNRSDVAPMGAEMKGTIQMGPHMVGVSE